MLILVEKVPEGAEVRKEALIRNYRERPLGQGHWTHLVHPLFGRDDGLTVLHNVLIVRIEAMFTSFSSLLRKPPDTRPTWTRGEYR